MNERYGWKRRLARSANVIRIGLGGLVILTALISFAAPAGAASTKAMNQLVMTSSRSTDQERSISPNGARPDASHNPYRKVTSASALKTWWPGWPSGSASEVGITVTATWADDPAGNMFDAIENPKTRQNVIHPTSYTASGMLGGFDQQASVLVDRAQSLDEWLGSYYVNQSDATAVYQRTLQSFNSALPGAGAACTKGPRLCYRFSIRYRDVEGSQHVFLYAIFAMGNVVGEAGVVTTQAAAQSHSAVVEADLNTLLKVGVHAVQKATSYPVPKVTVVGVGRLTTANGKLTLVHQVRVWHRFAFAIRFSSSATPNAYRGGTLWLSHGGLTDHVALKPGSGPDTLTMVKGTYELTSDKWEGSVKVRYSLTVSAAHRTGSFMLKVDPFK